MLFLTNREVLTFSTVSTAGISRGPQDASRMPWFSDLYLGDHIPVEFNLGNLWHSPMYADELPQSSRADSLWARQLVL